MTINQNVTPRVLREPVAKESVPFMEQVSKLGHAVVDGFSQTIDFLRGDTQSGLSTAMGVNLDIRKQADELHNEE